MYRAESGSDSAKALDELRSLIASGEGYMSKVAAGKGIKSVQTNARGATVVDRTG